MLSNIGNLTFDQNFMFLIQKITGETSQDIISYFYDLGRILADDILENSKARLPRKKTVALYKTTDIPFKLEIWPSTYYVNTVGSVTTFSMKVSFPIKNITINGLTFENHMIDSNLGFKEETIAPFEKPTTRRPLKLRRANVRG